jgi:hypothetical protein
MVVQRVFMFVIIATLCAACSPPQSCPVTIPNGSTPPGESVNELHHGNGELWTALWPDGEITFSPDGPGEVRPDGSLVMKFPWWRAEGFSAPIRVDGERLDGPQSGVSIEAPKGYGDTGFQASALVFPSEGCWQVTARVGDARLQFVVDIVQVE